LLKVAEFLFEDYSIASMKLSKKPPNWLFKEYSMTDWNASIMSARNAEEQKYMR
jgi:hypothetical protein